MMVVDPPQTFMIRQAMAGHSPRKKRVASKATEKTPTAAPADEQRLQKVLAAAGVGSRRKCEELILEGRVHVDGVAVTKLGTKVSDRGHEIRVDGELITQARHVYFMVHKPPGIVSTSRDPAGRARVIDLVPPDAGRLFNVGRLDQSSEGLILVTNDGELAHRLTHPSFGIEKTYHVQVTGHPDQKVLATLRTGVHLAEGFAKVSRVRVKSQKKQGTTLEIVLDEGRNREIRRLLASVGHKVQVLKRVAVGPLRLGDLPPGGVPTT